jgi:hypothetical protein
MKRKWAKETIRFRHMNGQVFATAIIEVDSLEFPELNIEQVSNVITDAMGDQMIEALEVAWRTKNDRLN